MMPVPARRRHVRCRGVRARRGVGRPRDFPRRANAQRHSRCGRCAHRGDPGRRQAVRLAPTDARSAVASRRHARRRATLARRRRAPVRPRGLRWRDATGLAPAVDRAAPGRQNRAGDRCGAPRHRGRSQQRRIPPEPGVAAVRPARLYDQALDELATALAQAPDNALVWRAQSGVHAALGQLVPRCTRPSVRLNSRRMTQSAASIWRTWPGSVRRADRRRRGATTRRDDMGQPGYLDDRPAPPDRHGAARSLSSDIGIRWRVIYAIMLRDIRTTFGHTISAMSGRSWSRSPI